MDKNIEQNIMVAVRIRPMNSKEAVQNIDLTRVEDNLIIVYDPVDLQFQAENKDMLDILHRSKEQHYAFDKIFKNQTNEVIYQETCQQLVDPVINGYNATVFAYGPTGTGKTYTMLGDRDKNVQGVSVLTIQDILNQIEQDQQNQYQLLVSYVEIYNENIRDLLIPNQQNNYLDLRDDPLKGIAIANVTEMKVENTDQIMNLLSGGNKRRTTESTNVNMTSSRSHAVFQIQLTKKSKTRNTQEKSIISKLSLIDLAGSERGNQTGNRGMRLFEGAKINRSLLALANCINALGDMSKKGSFVPYRDSKLTRMLKDSLGGNCKTVMIANISPGVLGFEETINTLKYANRAKNIKCKVTENKKLVDVHIAEYKNIITDLRQEINSLKGQVNANVFPKQINNGIHISEKQCSCDKINNEDQKNMEIIKSEISENFQERIQLRRALMELEEQNAQNDLEIRKKIQDIKNYKQEVEEMKKSKLEIQTIKNSTDKNAVKREILNLQLQENWVQAKKIREEIPQRIKTQDKRDYLEVCIKNHILDLQNIELEIHLQIQEKSIQNLKSIIENQMKIIIDNNINLEAEGDSDLQIDINNDKIEPDEEMEELNEYKDYLEKTQKNFWQKQNDEELDDSQRSKKSQKKKN